MGHGCRWAKAPDCLEAHWAKVHDFRKVKDELAVLARVEMPKHQVPQLPDAQHQAVPVQMGEPQGRQAAPFLLDALERSGELVDLERERRAEVG